MALSPAKSSNAVVKILPVYQTNNPWVHRKYREGATAVVLAFKLFASHDIPNSTNSPQVQAWLDDHGIKDWFLHSGAAVGRGFIAEENGRIKMWSVVFKNADDALHFKLAFSEALWGSY